MYRVFSLLAGGASLALASSALAAPFSLAEDARAFGARDQIQAVEISPGGSQLLYIAPTPGKGAAAYHVDLRTMQTRPLVRADGDPETLYWCAFGSDTQLVCQYGGLLPMEGDIVGFSRLVTIPVTGGQAKELGPKQSYYNRSLQQVDGAILDWLPDRPGSVLMARAYSSERFRSGSNIRDTRDGLGVDRIELSTLASETVEAPRREASRYLSDGRGNVRIVESQLASGERQMLTGVHRYRYRLPGSKDWKLLSEYDVATGKGSYPLAVDAGSNSAFMLAKHNGRMALFRRKLDGSETSQLVAANDKVDIDGIVRIGRGQRIIGYTFATEGRDVVYFDPEFEALAESLSKALPGRPAIDFEGASRDGTKLVIRASSTTNPGVYYIFDKASKRLDEVGPVRPNLATRTLAEMTPVSVPGPGGVEIPAYLTLPPGSSGKNLPAVVLPHGGPSARDELGFDWLSQFLSARGYAVIQPNFRGSAGYGDDWEGANAFRDWQLAIADISASARYLVKKGIADPNRLAIVGWSYGGYAALQSAAVEPQLYKAAVAIAPVTDLSLLKRQAENFTNSRLVEEQVGSGTNALHGSPITRASSIVAPVLLVHGDLDANVGIRHSEKMLGALQGAGKKAELLRFKGLDHQLDDSQARTQMLTRIGEFLAASIGS